MITTIGIRGFVANRDKPNREHMFIRHRVGVPVQRDAYSNFRQRRRVRGASRPCIFVSLSGVVRLFLLSSEWCMYRMSVNLCRQVVAFFGVLVLC